MTKATLAQLVDYLPEKFSVEELIELVVLYQKVGNAFDLVISPKSANSKE